MKNREGNGHSNSNYRYIHIIGNGNEQWNRLWNVEQIMFMHVCIHTCMHDTYDNMFQVVCLLVSYFERCYFYSYYHLVLRIDLCARVCVCFFCLFAYITIYERC